MSHFIPAMFWPKPVHCESAPSSEQQQQQQTTAIPAHAQPANGNGQHGVYWIPHLPVKADSSSTPSSTRVKMPTLRSRITWRGSAEKWQLRHPACSRTRPRSFAAQPTRKPHLPRPLHLGRLEPHPVPTDKEQREGLATARLKEIQEEKKEKPVKKRAHRARQIGIQLWSRWYRRFRRCHHRLPHRSRQDTNAEPAILGGRRAAHVQELDRLRQKGLPKRRLPRFYSGLGPQLLGVLRKRPSS